jgi:protein-S-isoprenylcysteine O-methyltransferase Ste14
MEWWDGVFVGLAVALVVLSRKALSDPRSHGFYRLFAFEAILGLLWRNLPYWFEDRYAPHQLLSWALLFSALYLLLHGLFLLRVRGGHAPQRQVEAANFAFENTARLVQEGLYRFIRHPLYASLLLLTWGLFCKDPQWLELPLALLGTLALVLTARVEERENLATFGDEYRAYMGRSRMFVPFIL